MDECLCFARSAMQAEPERYKWCGGTLWALYSVCPLHKERFVTPVWTQRIGRLWIEETATADKAVAVQSEAML